MSQATATDTPATTSNLDFLKKTLLDAQSRIRKLENPTQELNTICEAIIDAKTTDRCATDKEFNDWLCKELAIGIMQRLAKTTAFDSEVSDSLPSFPRPCLCSCIYVSLFICSFCKCVRTSWRPSSIYSATNSKISATTRPSPAP